MTDTNNFQSIIIETLRSAQSVGSEVYEKGKEFGVSAINTLQKEIPDILNQILSYEFFYHAIWALMVILFLISLWGIRIVFVNLIKNMTNEDDWNYKTNLGCAKL